MDWKSIVKSVAPTIGTALGGPMGGMASKFIAEKLLGDPDADTLTIENAINTASPEQLVKLKELENEFKTNMKQLDIDVFKLEVDDRNSARQLFSVNIWPQIVLSSVFVVGYFIILGVLLYTGLAITPMMAGFLGVITASIPQILGFWFGSSKGSHDKNAKINLQEQTMWKGNK